MTALTESQQDQALALVAAWLGPRLRDDGQPCPTGRKAAHSGAGPELIRDWEGAWTAIPPTPTIILEGAYGWADDAGFATGLAEQLRAIGVRAATHTGYALTLHPIGD